MTLRNLLLTSLAAVALGFGVLGGASGCSETDCDRAADKLESCGLPSDIGPGGSGCDSTSQCEADCINNHSCDEIRAALSGTPNAYSMCDDACN